MILFSIPVHERQDIIHNHIENILYYNPHAKIILHVNPTFTSFSSKYLASIYDNVYVNPQRYSYVHGKGLLWIHVQNFKYVVSQSIPFDTFVMLSSNEMFFQSGLNEHVKKYKNGIQLVKYTPTNNWHNFHKNLQNISPFKEMLQSFQQSYFFGGQAEGNFFEKDVFMNIADTYLHFFGNTELFSFETEEVVLQTIFEYLYRKNKSPCPPITLQNYSNDIPMTVEFIHAIRQNYVIENKTFHGTLISPHIRLQPLTEYAYSVKRIPREYCPLRKELSVSNYLLNQEHYPLEQKHYCHQSYVCLYPNNKLEFYFNDYNKSFGWKLEKGKYQISGEILFDTIDLYHIYSSGFYLSESKQIFRISSTIFHFQFELQTSQILYLSIPFQHIEIKDFHIDTITDIEIENKYSLSQLPQIAILLDITSDVDEYDFLSFQHQIHDVLSTLWHVDVYLHSSQKYILPFPSNVYYIEQMDDIFLYTQYRFILYISFPLYLKKGLKQIPFYINKINIFFYQLHHTNNTLTNDSHFILIPKQFFKWVSLQDKEHWIASIRKKIDSFSIHVMDSHLWTTEQNPYYTNQIQRLLNYGFLLQLKYIPYIPYSNSNAILIYCPTEEYSNRFYFYKKKNSSAVSFQWIGLPIYPTERRKIHIHFKIMFLHNVPILEKENVNRYFGIKTHAPLQFYNQWLYDCKVNEYHNVEWNTYLDPTEQFILLIFDDYIHDVHYYIRDFHYTYIKKE